MIAQRGSVVGRELGVARYRVRRGCPRCHRWPGALLSGGAVFAFGPLNKSVGFSLMSLVTAPMSVTTFLTGFSMQENFSSNFGNISRMAARVPFSEGISGI